MRSYCLVRGRLNKLGLVALIWLALCAYALAAQQSMTPTISVTINKSMVFRLAERAKRVSITQPAVADVLVVAPSQLLINGKAIGTTSLIVFDEKGDVVNYDLVVGPDIAALRAELRTIFPDEKIDISTSGPSLVLRGEVSNEVVYDRVLEVVISYLPPKPPAQVSPSTSQSVQFGSAPIATIASSGIGFAGGGTLAFTEEKSITDPYRWNDKKGIDGVIDLLVIKEFRQIELDVVVAEVNLEKAREIGFNFRYTGPDQVRSVTSALGSVADTGSSAVVGLPGFLGPPTGAFSYVNGAYTLTSLYRMLQDRSIAQILARPRLVVKNGRSAGFLSGGEVPIVTNTANTFGVVFKPFGVRLDFLPTLTLSDRVDLRVSPEVSEVGTVGAGGVPNFIVRRSITRVDLGESESLIIGGLLDQRVFKDLSKVPILGDVPILGTLFRSTRFRNRESELIFVITPRVVRARKAGEKVQLPPLEKYDHPDMRQVPVPGGYDVKRPVTPGASIP